MNNLQEKYNYQIVTWATNTTGGQITDKICELAAFAANSFFSQFIIPECNVKMSHWKKHKVGEYNGRKYRVLIDYGTNRILHSKTEVRGLSEFITWLEKTSGQSDGIILVNYEYYTYPFNILLRSMNRYRLTDRFYRVVKGIANFYDIAQDKFAEEAKYPTIKYVYRKLFNQEVILRRALAKSEAIYKIIEAVAKDKNVNGFIAKYTMFSGGSIQDKIAQNAQDPQLVKDLHDSKEKSNGLETEKYEQEVIDPKEIIANSISKSVATIDLSKYKVIGCAIDTTGVYFMDELFLIAAYTPNASFSQHILKKIIIKVNKVEQTKQVVDITSEVSVLKDFIIWLKKIKDETKIEGIVLSYHEKGKSSLGILLESLHRCKLFEEFSYIVKGFINNYHVSRDKCIDTTNNFKLNDVYELLMKKKIEPNKATIAAQACYEILDYFMKDAGESLNDGLRVSNGIFSYVNSIESEEKELVELKATVANRRNNRKESKQPAK